MLTEVGKKIDEYSEDFNKELENIKSHSKPKNTIIEIKTTL